MSEDKLLSPEEVADRLEISPLTVVRWLRSGKLKGRKYGRKIWRMKAEDLEVFIEQPEPMEGFLDLETPMDLFHKLEREYERWRQDPVNTDLAWNFFVTAEHLPDWLARADSQALGGKSINTFKEANPLLRICSHLANGGKHFKAKEHTSVQQIVRVRTVRVTQGPGGDNSLTTISEDPPRLEVYVTPKEQAALGWSTSYGSALGLAAQILEFWRNCPALQLFTEPSMP
jgi:excisionase family DNA binding protein